MEMTKNVNACFTIYFLSSLFCGATDPSDPHPDQPGPRSMRLFGGVAEKFDSPPYLEWIALLKMMASIGGQPFAIKRTTLIG